MTERVKRKILPIGIQSFREIREENYYYVDKTALAIKLVQEGKHYFLSRPRRFGKSLFLDTLKELFAGHQALFKGLAAEYQWDWSLKYPVLHFSFGGNNYNQLGHAECDLQEQLSKLEKQYQLIPDSTSCAGRFKSLILHLKA
ncbi:MAG: AAA family ATPase, partial [Proteobacteria bacterium]